MIIYLAHVANNVLLSTCNADTAKTVKTRYVLVVGMYKFST